MKFRKSGLLISFFLILVFLSYGIWSLLKDKEPDAKKETEVEIIESGDTKELTPYIESEEDLLLLQKYQDYNSDVVGIIKIEGTVLNHPIVQTVEDEEYYLYKDLDKKYNSHGVPFLSKDSQMEGQGGNCVVYGHNIYKISRDVFADLMGYKDVEYYKEHPVIETVSESGTRKWLIFAYFIVDNADADPFQYSDVTSFMSERAFEEYIYEVQKRNWLDVPLDLSMGDTILTLSSCSKELAGSGTNRMVVMAKQLVKDEDYFATVEGAKNALSPLLPEKLR